MPEDSAAPASLSDVGQLIIGGYTADMNGRAAGLSTLRVTTSAADEVVFEAGSPQALDSPSYVIGHPERSLAFAVHERGDGLVSSLEITTEGFRLIGTASTGGPGSCHLALSADLQHLLVANYVGGSVAAISLQADGSLVGPTSVVEFSGSGPDPERQDSSYAHQVVLDGEEILVADLGTDQVHRLRLADGQLTLAGPSLVTPPGSGPRHLVVVGDLLILALELSAEVLVARRTDDGWETTEVLPASSAEVSDRIYPSAIRTDGETVFVANRGAGTIATFQIDAAAARLIKTSEFPCGGVWPRDLVISEQHLWVANQTNDVISVFDRRTLPPTQVDFEVASPTPASIVLRSPVQTALNVAADSAAAGSSVDSVDLA